jgi:hypothetical protein
VTGVQRVLFRSLYFSKISENGDFLDKNRQKQTKNDKNSEKKQKNPSKVREATKSKEKALERALF